MQLSRRIVYAVLMAVVFLVGLYGFIAFTTAPTEAGLAAYVAAERFDPIFAIAGTDPDKLREAVNQLASSSDRIATMYSGADKSAIESLYPLRFLRLLPRLEASRQTLLTEPSIAAARQYHALLTEAIRTYASDARRIATLVRSTADKYPTLGYLSGTTTPEYTAAQIQAAGDDALSIQLAKEDARYGCLANPTNCPSTERLLIERTHSIATSSAVPNLNDVMRRVATLVERINSASAVYSHTEPIVLAFESTCVPSSTIQYAQVYYLASKHGFTRKLVPIQDAYFFNIDELHAKLPAAPQYAFLHQAGIVWMYQNPGNLYECPDAGFDQLSAGRLLSALEFLRTASTTVAETKRVLSKWVVSSADVMPYVTHAATVDSPDTNALTERYIEGSSAFDQIVLGAVNDNTYLFAASGRQATIPYLYVVAARNYASALLLMGNPTIVPKPHSFLLSHTASRLESLNLHSYINNVSRLVSDNALLAQYKKYFATEGFLNTP